MKMNNKGNNFCVILAGGKGRRLWPCSRETHPKQFMDFFGTGRTQLQQTFDRFSKLIPPERIYISTNQVYEHFVKAQLPELPTENILAEPIYRNTAPSVSWACYRIYHQDKDANIIVTPSDHAVFNEEAFQKNVLNCLDFVAKNDCLLTMGVKPTRPEPGYGYIQLGEETEVSGLYKVKSFTEKPERNFARMFMESGEFYWNTGIFLTKVSYLLYCFRQILPPVLNLEDVFTVEEEQAFIKANFSRYPNLSIDYGILEKSDNVYVSRCDFGWADLGTWHSIYEAMSKGTGDNVVLDSEVLFEDSHDNIVKLSQGRVAVINGLEGYIVAEKDNVLFICKKEDSSALVRKYCSEARIRYGDDFV